MTLKQVVGISDFSGINRVGVDSSGRLLVNLGAASVTVDISGDPVTVSGNVVVVSSTSVSGNAVNISGNTVIVVGASSSTTVIRTASGTKCTSLSGGVQLASLSGDRIIIKANQDNSGRIYLGSTTNPPFSGMGLQLAAGQSEKFEVTNSDVFRAFASASGDVVSYVAEDVI